MPTPSILIIEDDREISSTLASVLGGVGYAIRTASNGEDGQRLIKEARPDLIITDMMMPRMGGFPVLEFLEKLEDAPPVIMMTANEGGRHKAWAEMLGVVGYFRKPFAMEMMLDAVEKNVGPPTPRDAGPADSTGPGLGSAKSGSDKLRRPVKRVRDR